MSAQLLLLLLCNWSASIEKGCLSQRINRNKLFFLLFYYFSSSFTAQKPEHFIFIRSSSLQYSLVAYLMSLINALNISRKFRIHSLYQVSWRIFQMADTIIKNVHQVNKMNWKWSLFSGKMLIILRFVSFLCFFTEHT